MSTAIQLRKRGVVTLPKALRDKYGLDEGDSLHLADLGGVFVLTPMTPMVPQLSQEIERLRMSQGRRPRRRGRRPGAPCKMASRASSMRSGCGR